MPCNDFERCWLKGDMRSQLDQYLKRKLLGKHKMYSCDIWDCFSILGIFNQWDYISGNVEIAMTHMNPDSIYPNGSIYFMKNVITFPRGKKWFKQSFSPLSQDGSNNTAYQEDRTIFWPLSTKGYHVIYHHTPIGLRIVAMQPS